MVSVFSKDGLEPLVRCLRSHGVTIHSTGGTYTYIKALGLPVHPVEELTSYPSILGGRVKTLHPKVFGGILSKRGDRGDAQELDRYEIPEIDMVVVDLYPFRETVAQGRSESEIIEKIDIGGISLIRAAAKNHKDVLIVPDKDAYGDVQKLLEEKGGHSEAEDRKRLARRAFAVSASYDQEINRWMSGSKELRYGENPHQKGRFIGDLSEAFEQLHGKELSYNNLLDIDSAWWLLDEFEDTTFAILKHNNACGVASRESLTQAWEDALEADPVSAFGGVLAANRTINAEVAEKIDKLFFEILMAPDFSPEALEILQIKKNRILLRTRPISRPETAAQHIKWCARTRARCHHRFKRRPQGGHRALTEQRRRGRPAFCLQGFQAHPKQYHCPCQGPTAHRKWYWTDLPGGCPTTGNKQSRSIPIQHSGSGHGLRCLFPLSRLCGNRKRGRDPSRNTAGRVSQGRIISQLL